MQNYVKEKTKLLDNNGNLVNPGYSTKPVFEYNRKDIKASKLRIKEWDYYYIGNDNFGIALTYADIGYMGLISASFLDFKTKWYHTKSLTKLLPLGKMRLPFTSEKGDIEFNNKKARILFKNEQNKRQIIFKMKNFYQKQDLDLNVTLSDIPEDSMVIATPFKKAKHFYYNQKINCMKASGKLYLGNKCYEFKQEDSFGTHDWGRGVWTYKNTWYWGTLSTNIDGSSFGLNLGYGFGDLSNATENMIFYNGKAHKLDQVLFDIPKNNDKYELLKTWTITSNDNRLNLKFEPIINRHDKVNVLFLCSIQNQVFGYFSGEAILDDGTKITIDKKLGFAEVVFNKW